jgi:hypothetical protein
MVADKAVVTGSSATGATLEHAAVELATLQGRTNWL